MGRKHTRSHNPKVYQGLAPGEPIRAYGWQIDGRFTKDNREATARMRDLMRHPRAPRELPEGRLTVRGLFDLFEPLWAEYYEPNRFRRDRAAHRVSARTDTL